MHPHTSRLTVAAVGPESLNHPREKRMDQQTLLRGAHFDLAMHYRELGRSGKSGGHFDESAGVRRFGEGSDLVEMPGFGVDRRGAITFRTPHGIRKALHIVVDGSLLPRWLDDGTGTPNGFELVLDLQALPDGVETLDVVQRLYAKRGLRLHGA